MSTATVAKSARPKTPARRQVRRRRDPAKWIILVLFVVLAVVMLIPFAIVLINAMKTPAEYAQHGPLSLPRGVSTQGVKNFWDQVDFGKKLWNSFVIAGSVAVLAVLLSILNAYALGIGRIKGRTWVLVLFLICNTLPQEGLVYPLYYLAKKFGLYDTRLSVIIIFTVIQSAFGTYLFSSVLSTFPKEILEAAEMDGAGKWRALWRVVVPVSRPTITVMFVFFFIWTWNEFFIPMIMLISNDNQTVPIALGVTAGDKMMDATLQSSASLLGLLPAVIFFLIFQRTLSRGITAGAVK
jgi:raffinose/stachyose/melibiose transport system permease protein